MLVYNQSNHFIIKIDILSRYSWIQHQENMLTEGT